MIINHNMAAMNTHRQLGSNNAAAANNIEKLSSGLKINKAGDDAAGLAISEKMRGQIRGLDMAQKNSQDGISMIQTAEGALNETHDILQRMRELATQAANDTNVGVDREEIQKEMNNLSSEINRIGNTTEFNTQSLLKGNGKSDMAGTGINLSAITTPTAGTDATFKDSKVTIDLDVATAAGDKIELDLNGTKFAVTFANDTSGTAKAGDISNVSATGATVDLGGATSSAANDADVSIATAKALQNFIDNDDNLKGGFKVSSNGAGAITIEAVKDEKFSGSKGEIGVTSTGGGTAPTVESNSVADGTMATLDSGDKQKGTDTAATAASKSIELASINTSDKVRDLIGKGMTIGNTQVEFYDASKGAYEGKAVGVNIGSATSGTDIAKALVEQTQGKLDGVTLSANTTKLVVTSDAKGANSKVAIADGGVNNKFEAAFQVGANKGQSMTIQIADMRSEALGITGKAGAEGFSATNNVNNGTNNTSKEAALDVSTHEKATAAIKVINDAIETVSSQRSELGAFQNRLEHTINNLGTSSENLTGAESRIRDVDMAKEMMDFTKNNILTQAAQAMLSQANQAPQGVLQLLR